MAIFGTKKNDDHKSRFDKLLPKKPKHRIGEEVSVEQLNDELLKLNIKKPSY